MTVEAWVERAEACAEAWQVLVAQWPLRAEMARRPSTAHLNLRDLSLVRRAR